MYFVSIYIADVECFVVAFCTSR